jgi:hypothetical protein
MHTKVNYTHSALLIVKVVFIYLSLFSCALADIPTLHGYYIEGNKSYVSVNSEDTGPRWMEVGKKFRTLQVVKIINDNRIELIYRDIPLALPLASAPSTSTATPLTASAILMLPAPPVNPTEADLKTHAATLSAFLLTLPRAQRLEILRQVTSQVVSTTK